jgi:hypothetical protein
VGLLRFYAAFYAVYLDLFGPFKVSVTIKYY